MPLSMEGRGRGEYLLSSRLKSPAAAIAAWLEKRMRPHHYTTSEYASEDREAC